MGPAVGRPATATMAMMSEPRPEDYGGTPTVVVRVHRRRGRLAAPRAGPLRASAPRGVPGGGDGASAPQGCRRCVRDRAIAHGWAAASDADERGGGAHGTPGRGPVPRARGRGAGDAAGRRTGVAPARVVILGAGTAGCAATAIAQGMGAEVLLLSRGIERLQRVDQLYRGRIMTSASTTASIELSVADADLVVGPVLLPGGRAPVLVGKDLVRGHAPRLRHRGGGHRPALVCGDHPGDDPRRGAGRCASRSVT